MKLSAKKKGEIYDTVHKIISDLRIDLKTNYPHLATNTVDYKIAQVEIPMAQAVMRLLDSTYDND